MLALDKGFLISYNKKIPYEIRGDLKVKTMCELDHSFLTGTIQLLERYDQYNLGRDILKLQIYFIREHDDSSEFRFTYVDKNKFVFFEEYSIPVMNYFKIEDIFISNNISVADCKLFLLYDDSRDETRNNVALIISKNEMSDTLTKNDTVSKELKSKKIKDANWVKLFLE